MAQPPRDHAFVRTTKPKAAAAVRIGAGLGQRKRDELLEVMRPSFVRAGPHLPFYIEPLDLAHVAIDVRISAKESLPLDSLLSVIVGGSHRSEERRVGKECRSRW